MGQPISPRARIEYQCRAISRINGRPSARGRLECGSVPVGELISAPVAQQISAARFERDGRGCKSCREHHFPHVAQLEGGAPLRTETVRVQILPWGPFSPCSPTSRGAPLKTERLRVQIPPWGPLFAPVAQLAEAANLRSALCRCKSGLEHFFGACTGQANRDSVLTRSVGAC